MVKKVCRLRYRKGEPLGLTIYPAPNFASLPFEVRNMVYDLLLIDSEPIVVYTEPLPEEYHRETYGPQSSSKVAAVTFGLLPVNRMISIEAAAVFYHHNVFCFRGPPSHLYVKDPWDPLYSFLRVIGRRNRSHLQYIEAEISRPQGVWKDFAGSNSLPVHCSSWMRKVCAREQHPRTYPPMVDQRGTSFDYVSPAIEAVFRILGSEGSRLQLLLQKGFTPLLMGDGMYNDYDYGYRYGWSEEVVDHVEQMRRQFTKCPNGDGPRVDVQWKTTFFKSQFELKAREIEDNGWGVLEKHDTIGPLTNNRFDDEKDRTTCVTFQRKSKANLEAC
ncbi:hypothetical protein GLAREA_12846 [Glarea lozoyensis ATCC 20868]|uniref:Uncharacterized protein n=1 Tax=Glarea lozoyensis (strain ATCC 20868 / MF5171) TaxID=1116229 RepID=S3DUL8_GLAL2|nr:uncharacterized protein GLAREA_12846 [Glarea lozoyensis ATCC 20868]EPE30123.1 hypothetical protein GLAREA_12846 [Glarea lozoyensis ATCC 20868]